MGRLEPEPLPVAGPLDWLEAAECRQLSEAQQEELGAALGLVARELAQELLLGEPLDALEVRRIVESAGLDYGRVREAALRVLAAENASSRSALSPVVR
jgi:hypothetical protein